LGNIDYLIPFFAFALGSTLDLHNVVEAGLLGVALGLAVVAVTGLGEGINLRESAFLSRALAQFVVRGLHALAGCSARAARPLALCLIAPAPQASGWLARLSQGYRWA
jgi:2-keto-3-deoxygluconate permease